MTRYTDGLESGTLGITSAQSTRSSALMTRQFRFTGGGNQTRTGFLPYGAMGISSTLYILQNGSATTSDRFVVSTSTGATQLFNYTGIGSAQGLIAGNQAGQGVRTIIASACYQVGPNIEGADVPFQIVLSSTDTATDYGLFITFRRPFAPGT